MASREKALHLRLTTLGISDAGSHLDFPLAHEAPGFRDVAIGPHGLHVV